MWGRTGYILDPLLFILYVNHICLVSSCLYTIVFADDTSVLLSGKAPDVLSGMINKEICKLFKWLKANKLSHVKKTHYILSRSKHKSVPTMKTQVNLLDDCIGEVKIGPNIKTIKRQ